MYNLDLAESGNGWIMTTDNKYNECHKCGNKLGTSFLFCKEFKQAFCKECEKVTFRRLCNCIKTEHEHFNITEIRLLK